MAGTRKRIQRKPVALRIVEKLQEIHECTRNEAWVMYKHREMCTALAQAQ